MSDAPRYAGSPAQEFYDLARLYLEKFGEPGTDDYWKAAQLGRLRIWTASGSGLTVQYLRPCATNYEEVWSNANGFCVKDWHDHLETLRRALILDRLADV